MYTGTLIRDLTASVERVEILSEFRMQQRRLAEEEDFLRFLAIHAIQATQQPQTDRGFAGAA